MPIDKKEIINELRELKKLKTELDQELSLEDHQFMSEFISMGDVSFYMLLILISRLYRSGRNV